MSEFNPAYASLFPQQGLSLGLMTPVAAHGLADPGAARRIARLADDLGFAALWARDVPLMVPQGPDATASALDDPFLWLGMLAAATTRIVVGTAAIVLPLRQPLQVAKSALSLDRISAGRFVLGLGSGDRPEEFAAFGEDLEGRAATFRERWTLLRAAVSPEADARIAVLQATGGFDVLPAPDTGALRPMQAVAFEILRLERAERLRGLSRAGIEVVRWEADAFEPDAAIALAALSRTRVRR